MWWSKVSSHQHHTIEQARQQGLKAWRLSVVNAMLAETYFNRQAFPRPYRWSRSELSQLAGVDIMTVSERDAQQNHD